MYYTVKELADLTGLTPRTLRYYDAIGLLRPARDAENDYRVYAPEEVERLYRILVYREAGLPLERIGALLDGADRDVILREHLQNLREQQDRLALRIRAAQEILSEQKGEGNKMRKETFDAMKDRILKENEENYGAEIRERYGESAVESSYSRIRGLSAEQWEQMQRDETAYLDALRQAAASGDPAGEAAREACRLHLQWLRYTWKPEMCTPQAHRGLVKMYDMDDRFRAYYEERAGVGSAAFFAEAIDCYYTV